MVDVVSRLGHQLLDARGMDAPILDQPLHGKTGDLTPDGVKATDDDHAGRIVHDDIDAGGLLEGPDIPPLAANDPALHVVVGDVHRGDRYLAGLLGRIPLDGRTDDRTALVVGDLLGLIDLALDEGGHVMLAFVLQPLEEQLAGVLHVHPGDLEQLVLLLGNQDGELLVLALDVANAPFKLLLLLLDILFLLLEHFRLSLQDILSLGQSRFVVAQFGAGPVRFGGELLSFLHRLGGRLDLGGLDDILRFPFGSVGLPLQVLVAGLGPGPVHRLADNENEADTESEAEDAGRASPESADLHQYGVHVPTFHTSDLRNSDRKGRTDRRAGRKAQRSARESRESSQARAKSARQGDRALQVLCSHRLPIRHQPKLCRSYPQQHPSGVGRQKLTETQSRFTQDSLLQPPQER